MWFFFSCKWIRKTIIEWMNGPFFYSKFHYHKIIIIIVYYFYHETNFNGMFWDTNNKWFRYYDVLRNIKNLYTNKIFCNLPTAINFKTNARLVLFLQWNRKKNCCFWFVVVVGLSNASTKQIHVTSILLWQMVLYIYTEAYSIHSLPLLVLYIPIYLIRVQWKLT